jgi:Fe-S-cluster containining protein
MSRVNQSRSSRQKSRPSLSVPKPAIRLQDAVIGRLRKLIKKGYSSSLSQGFGREYANILKLFGDYQQEVLKANSYTVTCKEGCGVCCCHWAEDVYSFEARTIVDFLKKNHLPRLKTIVSRLQRDVAWLNKIHHAVRTAKGLESGGACSADIDPYDIALSSFYQLRRPCPLLGSDMACTVYPIRPLTCRIYVSFSPARFCLPQNILGGKAMTYLLDLEKGAMELFDTLHFMYDECDGDTGLRSMLLKLLSR